MSRKSLDPAMVALGIVAFLAVFIIFVPAILGTAAGAHNIEKYNGTGAAGLATPKAMHGVETLLIGVTTHMPMVLAIFAVLILIAIVLMMAMRKK